MSKYQIAMMPGDGIGVDVMEAAQLVLDAVDLDADYHPADVGWEFWCKEGDPFPQRTIDILKKCNCALFGAITSKPKEEAEEELNPELRGKGLAYRSPILAMRQMFDLYVNLRPCKAYPGNPLNLKDDIDMVIFRENTEGLYVGLEFFPIPDDVRRVVLKHHPSFSKFDQVTNDQMAMSLRVITQKGANRIIRKAFEYAEKFGYPKVTLAEKANVLRQTSGLMVREGRAVAAEFPKIELEITNIDAQMMWLVKNPEQYGVMVTSNLFGDILSDLAGQLVGGLGFAASGNIGDNFAIFEPSHGSAPKYAGTYTANPLAMLLSTKMMLAWLGETDKAAALDKGLAAVLAEGKLRTRDMGGSTSTLDMAKGVIAKM